MTQKFDWEDRTLELPQVSSSLVIYVLKSTQRDLTNERGAGQVMATRAWQGWGQTEEFLWRGDSLFSALAYCCCEDLAIVGTP